MWHKKFDKSFDQEEYDINKPEIIFHHSWNWYSDTLSIVPEINLYKKRRGAPGGPNLVAMDIADIGCTKRIASRVVGQLFDPSGVFLSILTGSCKIFYSKICQNTQGWDDLPADQELVNHFKEFLITVKGSISDLKPWPRCVRRGLDVFRKLVLHHDGSQFMASFVAFIISGPKVNLSPENGYSQLLTAGNAIKSHSVPNIEASGGLLAVENLARVMLEHQEDIIDSSVQFEVHLLSDSECYLWSLDPAKIHRAVLLKNL
jgi:hypothetical protein